MLARRKGLTGPAQTIGVLLAVALVLAIAWLTQYAMTRALQRPRVVVEPAQR